MNAQTAPAPTPDQLVAWLVKLLDVKALGEDRFAGRRKRGGIGRVFGGQVIGQALAAAEATVDPARGCHSLHAYFLRGGSEDHEIEFAVARNFDGGSFSNGVLWRARRRPPQPPASSQSRNGLSHASADARLPGPDDLPPKRAAAQFSDRSPRSSSAFSARAPSSAPLEGRTG